MRQAGKQAQVLHGYVWPVIVIILIVAAIMTKPSMASFEAALHQQLVTQLRNESRLGPDERPLGALLKVGCSLDIEACANLVRSQIRIKPTDFILGRWIRVKAGKRRQTCIGAFRNWFCTGYAHKASERADRRRRTRVSRRTPMASSPGSSR